MTDKQREALGTIEALKETGTEPTVWHEWNVREDSDGRLVLRARIGKASEPKTAFGYRVSCKIGKRGAISFGFAWSPRFAGHDTCYTGRVDGFLRHIFVA